MNNKIQPSVAYTIYNRCFLIFKGFFQCVQQLPSMSSTSRAVTAISSPQTNHQRPTWLTPSQPETLSKTTQGHIRSLQSSQEALHPGHLDAHPYSLYLTVGVFVSIFFVIFAIAFVAGYIVGKKLEKRSMYYILLFFTHMHGLKA